MGCVGSAAEHVLGGGRGVLLNNFPRRRYNSKQVQSGIADYIKNDMKKI